MKDIAFETFLGANHPLMASIFSVTTAMPSYEIMCPK